jgi:negative regulator of sigma-B (phosphoserine phosphatase)
MAEEALADPQAAFVEWASAARAFGDELVSGDQHVVADRPGGTLLAVIDGLGHGPDAAVAARTAARAVEEVAHASPDQILRHCHAASLETRGSAITLAAIDHAAGTMVWAGVGNVAGIVLHSGHSPSTKLIRVHAGIVGRRLPKLHAETLTLEDGDVVLLASDGINPNFAGLEMAHLPVQRMVDEILATQGVPTDDALVVAARYRRAGA